MYLFYRNGWGEGNLMKLTIPENQDDNWVRAEATIHDSNKSSERLFYIYHYYFERLGLKYDINIQQFNLAPKLCDKITHATKVKNVPEWFIWKLFFVSPQV